MSKKNKKVIAVILVGIIIASMTISVVFANNDNVGILESIVDMFITEEEKFGDKKEEWETDINKPSITYNSDKSDSNIEVDQEGVMLFSDEGSKKVKMTPKLQKGIEELTKNKEFSRNEKAKLNDYLTNNADTIAVYSLYDFLYENFFTYTDLDAAIYRYNRGEDLETIFSDYFSIEEGFKEREYQEGQLEEWIVNRGLSVEDIAVAEILDYRKIEVFDIIIEQLLNGKEMSQICEELGVINTSSRMNTVSISRDEINKCINELGITESEATKNIALAKKAKVETKDVINFLKNNESKGKYIKKYYEKQFK